MGFFNRLFGQKPPPERIGEAVATMERYVRGIMSHYGESHFKGDTQAKQILSVYSFGGVSALAVTHIGPREADPDEVREAQEIVRNVTLGDGKPKWRFW